MRAPDFKHFEPENNYYVATTKRSQKGATLRGDHSAETVIIGGGLAGLSTAMSLMERGQGQSTLLIEGQRFGFGASGRNGGFVFGGFSLGEDQMLAALGQAQAQKLYGFSLQAIDTIKSRIQAYNISCDATYAGVILANWFNETKCILNRQSTLAKLNANWTWLDKNQLKCLINSQRYHNGLFEENAFHFHPLKYAHGLAKALQQGGVTLYEHTPALGITPDSKGVTITTPQASLRANTVIITCGGYMHNFFPPLSRAILPISTYVMVTEPLGGHIDTLLPTAAAVYDTRFAFDYYRKLPDKRLLWGGRISILPRDTAAIKNLLRKDMLKVFPQLKDAQIDYAWGGLMGYPIHKMPLIGHSHPRIWHNTGFGGHGVGPTTAGGEIIGQALTGENNHYRMFYRYPPKKVWGPMGQLASQLTYWGYQAMDEWKSLSQRYRRGA